MDSLSADRTTNTQQQTRMTNLIVAPCLLHALILVSETLTLTFDIDSTLVFNFIELIMPMLMVKL